MKYCEKCKKNYPDNQVFCTECGSKLIDSAANQNQANNTNPIFENSNTNSSNSLTIWLPVIFAAVGALIGWFFSALLGFVLGLVGVGMVIGQKKQGQSERLPVILTWILAIIDTVFWILTLAL